MRQKGLAKRRKLKASDESYSSSPADVSTASQSGDPNVTTTLDTDVTVVVDRVQDARGYVGGQIAGYIFMCNTKTKPECFIYRVFGLPASRIGDVENIKPNTKLFLFDIDVKLLYGLYVAESNGTLALEPYAFGGRYPAQVKFSIAKDCLPLPEAAFRGAITENYRAGYKSKFQQHLSYEQVNKLVSLFRPITVPSSPHTSLTLHNDERSLHMRYMESTNQNIGPSSHEQYDLARSHRTYHTDIPGVQHRGTRVGYARNWYGENPRLQSTISPQQWQAMAPSRPSPLPSSSLPATQLVDRTAENQNLRGQSPFLNLPSSNGIHASHNGSNYAAGGHGYQNRGYPGAHQALSVTPEQPVNAYGEHLASVSSYYTQSHGNSAYGHGNQAYGSAYPTPPVTKDQVDNVPGLESETHSTYWTTASAGYMNQGYPVPHATFPGTSTDPRVAPIPNSAAVGYGYQNQGYPGYHQAQPVTTDQGINNVPNRYVYNYEQHPTSVNSGYTQSLGGPERLPSAGTGVGAANAYSYYDTTNATTLAHEHGNQGYYSSYQTVPVAAHQEVNHPVAHVSQTHPS